MPKSPDPGRPAPHRGPKQRTTGTGRRQERAAPTNPGPGGPPWQVAAILRRRAVGNSGLRPLLRGGPALTARHDTHQRGAGGFAPGRHAIASAPRRGIRVDIDRMAVLHARERGGLGSQKTAPLYTPKVALYSSLVSDLGPGQHRARGLRSGCAGPSPPRPGIRWALGTPPTLGSSGSGVQGLLCSVSRLWPATAVCRHAAGTRGATRAMSTTVFNGVQGGSL